MTDANLHRAYRQRSCSGAMIGAYRNSMFLNAFNFKSILKVDYQYIYNTQ